MTEQPTLFGEEPQPPPTTREPAPWVKRHGHNTGGYSTGCRCAPCVEAWRDYNNLSRQGLRRCQHCSDTYPRTTGGGTKFCATCITADVYWRNYPKVAKARRTCARCGTSYRKLATAPWELCPTCTQHPVFDYLKGSLGKHHAPTELVLEVIDWPYCANEQCGAWLLEQVNIQRATGGARRRGNFAIDHDHTCCPGQQSACGRCIRGVLCRRCNHMLITDNPATLRGLAEYLDRHATR